MRAAKQRRYQVSRQLRGTQQQMQKGEFYCLYLKFVADFRQLSEQDVILLMKVQVNQRCDWRSDLVYESDFGIKRLRNQICNALIRLEGKSVEETSSPTSNANTIGDNGETGSGLDIENLRVNIDISNSLRGIFQIQHRRQAQREAAAGNPSALAHIGAENFPPIPPRVGPSTLPRSIGLVDDEEPSDNSKTAGKKRARF
ncbi:hypothetical protein FPANT_6699 [Fusarium pseudoanthophilum]|uniref:Uncharacterized protein n=1 Tax=Fusarium pseudoanthophilum TaxID=48495 RepID=A0A8H5LBH4_9HYPO|nr:hypothetical protein FPANT_6699 [Fusarium pseudoanthophilum]